MELELGTQLWQAGLALALGAGAGLLYDLFRVLRRHWTGTLFAAAADGLFWVICFLWLHLLGLSAGQGRQRGFLAVFACLGGAAWLALVSPLLLPVLTKGARLCRRGLRFLFTPLRELVQNGKKFFVFLKYLFSKWKKRCTINYQMTIAHYRRKWAPKEEACRNEVEAVRYLYEDRPDRSPDLRHHGPDRNLRKDRGGPEKRG